MCVCQFLHASRVIPNLKFLTCQECKKTCNCMLHFSYKNMQSRLSLDLCSHRRWTSSRPTYCFPKRDMSFPEMGYIGPENPIKNLPRLEVQLPLAAVLYARYRSADSVLAHLRPSALFERPVALDIPSAGRGGCVPFC